MQETVEESGQNLNKKTEIESQLPEMTQGSLGLWLLPDLGKSYLPLWASALPSINQEWNDENIKSFSSSKSY